MQWQNDIAKEYWIEREHENKSLWAMVHESVMNGYENEIESKSERGTSVVIELHGYPNDVEQTTPFVHKSARYSFENMVFDLLAFW